MAINQQYSSLLRTTTSAAWQRITDNKNGSRWRYSFAFLVLLLLAAIAGGRMANQATPFSLHVRAPTWHTHHVVTTRSQDQAQTFSLDEGKAPQPPRLYNVTVDSIAKLADQIIAEESKILDDIIKNIKPEDATFENVILPYVQHENEQTVELSVLYVLPYVGVTDELEEACQNASAKVAEVTSKTNTSPEFYALIDAVYQKQKDDEKLDDESRLLIDSFWGQFQGAGFSVPEGEQRTRLTDIGKRLEELATAFDEAVSGDPTTLYFNREELAGVEKDFLDGLEKGKDENDGKLALPIAILTNYLAVAQHCKNATTRHTLVAAWLKSVPDNVGRLEEAVALRDEEARILGYPDFATLHIEGTMAQTPKAVNDLLDNLVTRMAAANEDELEEMKKLKLEEEGNADNFWLWDEEYYLTKLDEQIYKVDNDFIKEYFESTTIVQNVLDMYSEIWSLRYVKIEGKDADEKSPSGKGGDLVWHPDVELFEVWNNEKEGDEAKGFMGYLYIDLFNRKNKMSGSFAAPIDPGFTSRDGSRHYPTSSAVLNIVHAVKSTSEKPTLLLRDDVSGLLHELGHVTHHIVSKTKYARFHGPGYCPRDFVELPSQLMENWSYDRRALKRLGKHYSYLSPQNLETWKKEQNDTNAQQPPEILSDDQIDNISRNKNAASGNFETRQTMYSKYDMTIESQPSQEAAKSLDSTTLWNQMRLNITKIEGGEEGGFHRQSTFTHFMLGYEAAYYGYTWSRVQCKDVFYTAFQDDPFSSEAGGRWRHIVLEPGSSKDYLDIVTEFLGRAPSDENFFKSLGIDEKTGRKKRDVGGL